MRKKFLGIILLVALCFTGCGKNAAINNNADTGKDVYDTSLEFTDLHIGDTVCVATSGADETYQYKFTLNSVEYAESEINGFPVNGSSRGFTVIDVTLENVGPDVSYGIIFSQLYIDGFQFYPNQQSDYGLNTFSDPDAVLAKGEKITGKIALQYSKRDLMIKKDGILTTQFTYNIDESEIKDYVPGEQ